MEKIRNFEEKITNYKNELFALRLFYGQAKILWSYSMLNSIHFEKHYHNIINRGNEIIKRAEKTLKDVKVNHNLNLLYKVEFPLLEKDMMLLVNPDGIERLKLLLETYYELFPGRDKDIPLTVEEHKLIMNRIIEKY